MLFPHIINSNSKAYKEQQNFVIIGALDPLCFHQAWNIVFRQNRVLQSAVGLQGSAQFVQVFPCGGEAPFVYQDLSAHDNAEEMSLHQDEVIWQQQDDYRRNLIRIYLRKITDMRYHLIICFHHILMDGWSYMILLEQLFKTYTALRTGNVIVNRQDRYLEYLEWKQHHRTEHEGFWLNYLNGIAQIPDSNKLLCDAAYYSALNQTMTFSLSAQNCLSLKLCAKLINVTTAVLYYTFWAIAYTQWSQTCDFLLGMVVSGRNTVPMNVCETTGLFMETLPLHIQINLKQTCLELVRDIAYQIAQVQEHPLVELSRILSYHKIPKISQTMVIQNYPTDYLNDPGCGIQLFLLSSRYALTAPLTISIREKTDTGTLLVAFSYHPLEYDSIQVKQLWYGFHYLLTHADKFIQYQLSDIAYALRNLKQSG